MKEKIIKRILDWLLEAFMWVYEIFLYSLILPLALGVIVLFLTPVANWFIDHWFIYIPVSVAVGFFIRNWLNNHNKKIHERKN